MPNIIDERDDLHTLVHNDFLDYFMPRASGQFVKIYLYLLRSAKGAHSVSPAAAADVFSCTESDILRAYKYWEKEGLLKLTFEDNNLLEIRLLPCPHPAGNTTASDSVSDASDSDTVLQALRSVAERNHLPSAIVTNQAVHTPALPPRQVSRSQIRELAQTDQKEVRQITLLAEGYLKHPLSTTELGRLLYIYTDLHFTPDMIDFLISYCVDKNKPSLHYIEKTAFEWYNDGIETVEEAKQHVKRYRKEYFNILRAFGITGRQPVSSELSFMKKWLDTYRFSPDLIHAACERTIMKKKQASFEYADAILKSWKENQVASLADVERLDTLYQNRKEQNVNTGQKDLYAPKSSSSGKTHHAAANRFNNFQQRTYDYADLEKQLLNRQLTKSDHKE